MILIKNVKKLLLLSKSSMTVTLTDELKALGFSAAAENEQCVDVELVEDENGEKKIIIKKLSPSSDKVEDTQVTA